MTELRPAYIDGLEVAALELRLGVPNVQGGVMDANALKVTAGAGNTIDVAPGWAFIDNNFGSNQGRYVIANDATKNSVAFEGGGLPAPGAQPAVHQIVAKMWDPAYEAVGVNGRRWRLMVVPGVATSGATIDNRSGAVGGGAATNSPQLAADPWKNTIRLADVHQSTAGVLTIRDRRPWARGFNRWTKYTAGSMNVPTAALGVLNAVNLGWNVEVGPGGLLIADLTGWVQHTAAGGQVRIAMAVDGVAVDAGLSPRPPVAADPMPIAGHWPLSMTPGYHNIQVWGTAGATGTLLANASNPVYVDLREKIAQDAVN
jgi:hypothetical protein